jgi:hypothetical protein
LILGLHNNGCTGIDQPNTYSRRFKMTKQKQMTERKLPQCVELSDKELVTLSGGLSMRSAPRGAEHFSKNMIIINTLLGMKG